MTLFEEVDQWLYDRFPGSTLADGYFFLAVKRKSHANLKGGNTQLLIDELTKGRAWVIVVGADPRPFTTPIASEAGTVTYNPDWNVNESVTQWAVEVQGKTLDLSSLEKKLEGPTLVAIFAPNRNLILHLDLLDLHATEESEIEKLKADYPECFAS